MDDQTFKREFLPFENTSNYVHRVRNFGIKKLQIHQFSCYELRNEGMESLSQIARHFSQLKELKIAYARFFNRKKLSSIEIVNHIFQVKV